MFVLDASVTACWAFDDEDHPIAAQALDRLALDPALVPFLWWYEIRNTLIVNERRGRITSEQTGQFLEDLALLPIQIDRITVEESVLRIARDYALSVYDAAYLELANREGLALATFDKALIRAAEKTGIPLC